MKKGQLEINRLGKEFVSYTIVGGIAFLVDFSLLYLLTEWYELYYLISATISFLTGLFVNYALCLVWVFSYRSCNDKRVELFLFTIVGLGGVALTDVLMAVLTPLFRGQYLWSKAATAFFVLLWNFFLRRQLLFAENPMWKALKQFAEVRREKRRIWAVPSK